MNVGFVGFARSGKTTVFDALTGAHAAVGAFGDREAHIFVIKVPDARVDQLADIFKPKKKAYVEVRLVDIPPRETRGEGKALDPATLNLLKNADALVHVVRAFASEKVVHPCGPVDPVRDSRALEEELLLDDLLVIERRQQRMEKEHRKDREFELLSRCRKTLESGVALRTLHLSPPEERDLAGFGFLSRKPILVLGNYGEEAVSRPDPAGLDRFAAETGFPLINLCGELELEVAQLAEEERAVFRKELGLGEDPRTVFLQAVYALLGLVSFLTTKEPEVRAWAVRNGTTALEAAGVIHSDMQRGFIRAEVVPFADFIAAGSMAKAREHGHVRLEGKDYVVHDGDIILFRFNI
jgi:GTP-binding protein YchF